MGRAGGSFGGSGSRSSGSRSGGSFGGSSGRSSGSRSGGSFGGRSSGSRSGGSFGGSGSRGSGSRSGGSFGGSFGSSRSRSGGSFGSSRSRSGGGSGGSSGGGFNSRETFGGFGRTSRPRTVVIPPIFSQGRTIVINNGGSSVGNGSSMGSGNSAENRNSEQSSANQTTRSYRMEQPITQQPLTSEQKINRAERLAKEAGDGKKGAMKLLFVAAIIIAIGIFSLFFLKNNAYEKAELSNAKDTDYVKDVGFLGSTYKTEAAIKDFRKKTGIPLYICTINYYGGSKGLSSYVEELYDELFSDEDHVLILYCNNPQGWEYSSGARAKHFFDENEFNNLVVQIDKSADLYGNYPYDEIMARGIQAYTKELTSVGGNSKAFAIIILLVGAVLFVGAVLSYVSKSGAEKRYAEEAATLRTEQMLSKPLETFGNDEIERLKDKYD